MKKYLCLFYVLVIIFTSCTKRVKTKKVIAYGELIPMVDSVQQVILSDEYKIEISDLISKIDFIRLETPNNALIGRIDKLLQTDNDLIVVDKRKSRGVFRFNNKGKFLNKIGAIGNGPEEFVEITDVTLIPNTDHVAVLDRARRKVHLYKLNGKYVKTNEVPLLLDQIAYMSNDQIIGSVIGRFYNIIEKYKGYSLFTFDSDWNITGYGFKDPFHQKMRYTSLNQIKQQGDYSFYTPPFENKIFSIDSVVTLCYEIVFSKEPMLNDLYDITESKEFSNLLFDHGFFDGGFINLRDWLVVKAANRKREETFFYNKNERRTYSMSPQINTPLQSYLPLVYYKGIDNTLIAELDASNLIKAKQWLNSFSRVAKSEHAEAVTQIDRLLDGLSEYDNPVLLIYNIKPSI